MLFALLVVIGCKTDVGESTEKNVAARQHDEPGATCRPGQALAPAMRSKVEAEARSLYGELRSGRFDAIWSALHPRARLDDQKQAFTDALASMQARLQNAVTQPALDMLHVVEVRGRIDDVARVVCEGIDGKEGFTLYTDVDDEHLAVVTLLADGGPLGLAATISLRKHAQSWRLVGIQVNPATYKGKNAIDWELVADDYWRADKPLPSYLMLGVAQALSSRGASIKTASKDRINEKLESLRDDKGFAEDTSSWTIEGRRYELAGVSLAATIFDLSPVIKYVTQGELGDRETLEREVDALLNHVRRLHPELSHYFGAIVFEAYAEPPTVPGQRYDAHRLVRPLTDTPTTPAG